MSVHQRHDERVSASRIASQHGGFMGDQQVRGGREFFPTVQTCNDSSEIKNRLALKAQAIISHRR
jgi:hypothetical protein